MQGLAGQLPQIPLRQPGTLGPAVVNEPLTHGLPTGPGGGPEVLQQFRPDPLIQAQVLLSGIPSIHQTPALKALSAAVNASVANSTQPSIEQGLS